MAELAGENGRNAQPPAPRRGPAAKIDAAAWGLLFIWVGVVWLAGLHLSVALLGFAAVILGSQLARRAARLRLEMFWVVMGLCLAIAGAWDLVGIRADVIPFLFILVGVALLMTLFARVPRTG